MLAGDRAARARAGAAGDDRLIAHAGQIVQCVLIAVGRVADRDARLEVVGLPAERRVADPVREADAGHAEWVAPRPSAVVR